VGEDWRFDFGDRQIKLGIETVESAVNTATDAVKGQTGDLGAEAQKAGADLKNAAQKTGCEFTKFPLSIVKV